MAEIDSGLLTPSLVCQEGETEVKAKVDDIPQDQETLPTKETVEMTINFLPEFIRVQLTLIHNSKKLGDYNYPEDLAIRVGAIVDNLQLNMSYVETFQKVVRQVREEFGIFESKIMTIIRTIVTNQNADVATLCNSGLEILSDVGKVYGGLSARAPPLPKLSGQTVIDPELSSLFLDFVEYETIRFVSYAALFYHLKGNKLPSIQTISSILGCRSPFHEKNCSTIAQETRDLYSLERRVETDFKKRYPDEVEDDLEIYLESLSSVDDDDDNYEDVDDTETDLEIGDPVFSVKSVSMNRMTGSGVGVNSTHQSTGDTDNDKKKLPILCDISVNEYLIGVLYMAFQLSELGLMAGIHGGSIVPEGVAKFLAALHNCYLELDHVNGPLRRTFDRLKYELRQANAVAKAIELKESLQENPTKVVSFRVFNSSASALLDDEYADEY